MISGMTSSLLKFLSLAIIAVLLTFSTSSASCAGEDGKVGGRADGPVLELPTDVEQCIRPTEFMRVNHMYLLEHKRDQTMRQGIRTDDASLQGCVDCHAKKDDAGKAIPVNDPGQFCAACHEYVSVKLDCFTCHRTTPDMPASTANIPRIPAHKELLAANTPPLGMPADVQKLRAYLDGELK
ncbi:MAG: hypothetical protein L3J32_01800 [Rhizobiaceae bacterium]|nr:hypothetical protein [Rhizobiaceae bacterium]